MAFTINTELTQLEKILNWATLQIGSTEFHGYCQAFVYRAVATGIGHHDSPVSAREARQKWMFSGTGYNYKPPAGAAVYFNGTGTKGSMYGHVALSIGDGYILDPVDTVKKLKLYKNMNGGYLGWGWQGGIKPEGSDYIISNYSGTPYSNNSSTSTSSSSSSKASSSGGASGSTGNSSASSSTKNVEISTVVVKSESGTLTSKTSSDIGSYSADSDLFLLIQGDDAIYRPILADDIKISWEQKDTCGKMTFSYIDVDGMKISEGNAVAFRYKNNKVFYGYIFIIDTDSDREKVSVTCYDQLRYFKNKDTFVYNKKYSDMLIDLCKKYNLTYGTIEDTGYIIPTRVEDGTLFDICKNANELTLVSKNKSYVLYDDFGKITLREMGNMTVDLLLDKDTTGKWKISRSIDSDVYNRVVVSVDDNETGVRKLYVANNSEKQAKWGVLQTKETFDGEASDYNIQNMAEVMLKYYSRVNKTFRVNDCLGDDGVSVRGGSILLVDFDIGNGETLCRRMIVNKVEHKFSDSMHLMDIELYGGDWSA